MQERPPDVSDADLTAVVSRYWRLDLTAVRYLPAGYGGYHWEAVEASGRRWFVTLTRIDAQPKLADLEAAMATAAGLAAAGLAFVVAPVPAADERLVVAACNGYAATLYPFADGIPGQWGDCLTAADTAAVISMLADLHAALPRPPLPPVRRTGLDRLEILDTAVRERTRSWSSAGPYAEKARALVSEHADGLLAAADRFRELAETAAGRHDQVITHGEPHSGNLIRGPAGLLLIDWDTVGLAPPERDLWWLIHGDVRADGAAAGYEALTGRTVSEPAIVMYRLRWDLDDVCLFLAEFRGPHDRNQDTEIAFAGLVSGVRALAGARAGRPE